MKANIVWAIFYGDDMMVSTTSRTRCEAIRACRGNKPWSFFTKQGYRPRKLRVAFA